MSKDFKAWLRARTKEGEGGCLIWQQALTGAGYPAASWEGRVLNVRPLAYDQIGPGGRNGRLLVMTCHNKQCVEVQHMALKCKSGVAKHNPSSYAARRDFAADIKRRDNAPARKLTIEQARAIRARLAAGERQVDLAREFSVRKDCISRIWTGKAWKDYAMNSSVFAWSGRAA